MALRPVANIGSGIDMSQRPCIQQLAAPVAGKKSRPFQAYIIIVAAGYCNGRKWKPVCRHGRKPGSTRGVRRGFRIAGGYQQCRFDTVAIARCPLHNSAAGKTVANQHNLVQGVTRKFFFNGFCPLTGHGVVPVSLLYTGVPVIVLPVCLPVLRAGIIEPGKDKAVSSTHGLKFAIFCQIECNASNIAAAPSAVLYKPVQKTILFSSSSGIKKICPFKFSHPYLQCNDKKYSKYSVVVAYKPQKGQVML